MQEKLGLSEEDIITMSIFYETEDEQLERFYYESALSRGE